MSSASSRILAVGFAAVSLATLVGGCSTDDGGGTNYGTAGTGTPGASGSASTAGTGGAGQSGSPGQGGGMTTAGTGGAPATAGTGGVPTTAGTGGAAGSGGTGGTGMDITKVWKSAGCGMAAPQEGAGTVATMGTKDADCAAHGEEPTDKKCGPWNYTRKYVLDLPDGYDSNTAYPIVFMGPGCGSSAQAILNEYDYDGAKVIRVGVTPVEERDTIGHGTNPGEGCFDDKEGDDAVDWVMYEELYKKLSQTVCFDRNRVFASGNSSGAWFSNELGCKYAGHPEYPVRGIMPNTGGLPAEPQYKPTCTDKPMAGMWVHETGDPVNGFAGNKYAIARAMMVNGCTMGTDYDTATFDPWPVDGRPANECRKMQGCPELYPIVVCPLNGNGHGGHGETVNPSGKKFLEMFTMPPFLTQ
jgi:poly(3-hydroxybutyrate) depolymerase